MQNRTRHLNSLDIHERAMKTLVHLYRLNALLPIHRIDDCMPVQLETLGQGPHNFRMPTLNGLEAPQQIRHLEATKLAKTNRLACSPNGGRIPIFAVERQREELDQVGIDGWVLKPIDFGGLYTILRGVTDPVLLCKANDKYRWRQLGDRWVAAATLTTITYIGARFLHYRQLTIAQVVVQLKITQR